MGIHDGHRQRMKRRFLEHGIDNFEDHAVLELLLYYAIPQGDVNPVAHRLLSHFGSLSAVFDAPAADLMKISGVGENTATLIKLLPQICRRYLMSRSSFDNIIDSPEKAGEFIKPYFFGQRDEVVYLICLDAKCKMLSCKRISSGDVTAALMSIRKIVEYALACNATSVILAHNHPSGIALPSEDDMIATRKVQAALKNVDITLADHIIVADDDFVSMSDNGFFN